MEQKQRRITVGFGRLNEDRKLDMIGRTTVQIDRKPVASQPGRAIIRAMQKLRLSPGSDCQFAFLKTPRQIGWTSSWIDVRKYNKNGEGEKNK